MKQRLLTCLCVASLTLGTRVARGSQPAETMRADAVVVAQDESLDELDMLVDEAALNENVFKGNPAVTNPTGFRLFLMRCGVPLVGVYTSTVLKYRAVKSWFKLHCVEPVMQKVGSHVHCCGCCHASEISDQK